MISCWRWRPLQLTIFYLITVILYNRVLVSALSQPALRHNRIYSFESKFSMMVFFSTGFITLFVALRGNGSSLKNTRVGSL